MAVFDISKANNFKKHIQAGVLEGGYWGVLNKIAITLTAMVILASLFSADPSYRGMLEILFAVLVSILFLFNFLRSYNQASSNLMSDNLAEAFDKDQIEIILQTINIARENQFSSVEPILLLAAIEQSHDGKYLLLRAGFGLEKDLSGMIADAILKIPRTESGQVQFSDEFIAVINDAKANAQKNNHDFITTGDLLIGLIDKCEVFKQMMYEIKIKQEDLQEVVEWKELLDSFQKIRRRLFYDKPVSGGIGKDWSYGFTRMLNQYARNLNTEIEFSGEAHVYGRAKEVDEIERILSKTSQNNALLIGAQGIGKKTIMRGFVSRVVAGNVLPALKYTEVFQVDTGALLSGSANVQEIASKVKQLLNEASRAGNIILFFDNFQDLVSRGEGVGQANTSEIILPYLQGAVRIVGATNIKSYHRDIEPNVGVAALFEKVEVHETSVDETISVLEEMVPPIEHRDGVFWPYQAVREVVRVAGKYIQNKPFPTKAIELVDEVSVAVAKTGGKIVLPKMVDDHVSAKLEVPVIAAEGKEAQKLLHLEEFLHQRVIGQDEAVKAVSAAMRRARAGLAAGKRPIGTFLFLGTTGVGKTETSKALAEAYFGSEKSMIRVDMSEYQEPSSIYKLLGSPPSAGGEGEKGQLTTAVMDNPFSLILLDEIEKAHKDILTLFLQVFDDGRLTDGTGQVIDFTNTIIISTSNAGSELIRQALNKKVTGDPLKKILLEYLQRQGIFRPEFLNRFDAVVAFHPLSPENIFEVAKLMLKKLAARMAEKEINLKFTDAAVTKLAKLGFDPVYGARPMRRAIQDKVENALAESILSGKTQRGASILIDEKDII
ncbi:MAG: ATP-dependent Clp protease ATP-binding subunit [bacterium]